MKTDHDNNLDYAEMCVSIYLEELRQIARAMAKLAPLLDDIYSRPFSAYYQNEVPNPALAYLSKQTETLWSEIRLIEAWLIGYLQLQHSII